MAGALAEVGLVTVVLPDLSVPLSPFRTFVGWFEGLRIWIVCPFAHGSFRAYALYSACSGRPAWVQEWHGNPASPCEQRASRFLGALSSEPTPGQSKGLRLPSLGPFYERVCPSLNQLADPLRAECQVRPLSQACWGKRCGTRSKYVITAFPVPNLSLLNRLD